jgi:hypothetical protein
MKKYSIVFLLILPAMVYAQQQPPGTEIYLLDLNNSKKGLSVTNPQNITNRSGYDNQPCFHPDKSLVYYTSANAEGKTDLVEYNYETKSSRQITTTPEREYSPTVTPDKQFLSCIIQRDNGAQDLGKYPIEGGDPTILVSTLTVGYHAWIDADKLLLFVLGDTMTLRKYDLYLKKSSIIEKRIGRSLHKIPNTTAMSFVHKISDTEWVIKRINDDGTIVTITKTLPGREDLTWTNDGRIIMSDGKKLFYFQPEKTETWQEIEMPATMPAGSITRLTVNAKTNLLAIVVSE